MFKKLIVFLLYGFSPTVAVLFSGTPGTPDYEEYVKEGNDRRVLCVCRRRDMLAAVQYCSSSICGRYSYVPAPIPKPVPVAPRPVPTPIYVPRPTPVPVPTCYPTACSG